MKIFAYLSSTDDTPGGQWVARIWCPESPLKGPKSDWWSIIFTGINEGSVRNQAQTWWDDMIAKETAKRTPKKKPMEAPTGAPAEEIGDVL